MVRVLSISLSIAFLYGCAASHPPVEPIPPQLDKWGCSMPAQAIALNNQGLNLEAISFKEFAIGKVDYKSNPDLKILLEKEAVNAQMAEYLLCNAKERGDVDKTKPEQIQYLRVFFHFIQSRPTPDQISDYPKKHPFPASSDALKTSLSMDCRFGFLPKSAPHNRVYAMNPYPTEVGGGLPEYFSADNTFKWPELNGLQMTGYACEIMNGSNASIFNVSMALGLIFRDVIIDPKNKGARGSSEVKLAKDYPVTMARIDSGPNGTFLFYIFNTSPQFIEIIFPKSATFEHGTRQQETTSMIHPSIQMILGPWKGEES